MDGELNNVDMSEFDGPIEGEDAAKNSRANYLKNLKDMVNPVNDIRAGLFYSFSYRSQAKEKTVNQFAFTDFNPLIYLYGPIGKDKLEGLNFHFLPVDVRLAWLDIVDKMAGGAISNNERITIPPEMLKRISTKIEFARRVYDVKGIREWKRVNSENMWDLCKMTPGTYGGANYNTVATGFRIFNPLNSKNGSRG